MAYGSAWMDPVINIMSKSDEWFLKVMANMMASMRDSL
jgi:hypothetical protein